MNQSRFRISHLILSIFLVSFGCVLGYLLIKGWISTEFNILFLGYIPMFCIGVILPVYAGIAFFIDDIKKIRAGENNSMYEDENK